MRRLGSRWRAWRLVGLCFGVHRVLTVTFFSGVVVTGLLAPAFTIATGALVAAVASGDGARLALAVVSALYLLQRLLAPLEDEIGGALARRVDESLTERLMVALAAPPGLAHVEDPAMLHAIAKHARRCAPRRRGATAGRGVDAAAAGHRGARHRRLVAMVGGGRGRAGLRHRVCGVARTLARGDPGDVRAHR